MKLHAHRALVRVLAMGVAMVGAGLAPTMVPAANAAANFTTSGERVHIASSTGAPAELQFAAPGALGATSDPDNSPTASKPQSKLWYADGQWWGVLLQNGHFDIWHFDAATRTWNDTGVLVDNRPRSRIDVLWDGTHLYTVGAVGAMNTTAADAIKFTRFTYDSASQTYTADIGPKSINGGGVEAAVIAKDGQGTLWVAYTAAGTGGYNARYVKSTDGGQSFSSPASPPFAGATGLNPDDIATVVGHTNSVSIAWSHQGATTADVGSLYVATYDYNATPDPATDKWSIQQLDTGPYAVDDHLHMSVDGDGAGRVFLVVKESTNDKTGAPADTPLIRLWVRSTSGSWTPYTVWTVSQTMTRPVVVLDRDADKVRVFATSPESGGAIYEKTTSFANPSDFAAGDGTVVLKTATDPHINNVTTTKQNVTNGTGLLLLASDQTTGYYVDNNDSVPTGSTPPATLAAAFTMDKATGNAPLAVKFTDTSTGGAKSWSWDFGDSSAAVTEQNPTHTFTKAGTYTVKLTVGDGSTTNSTTQQVKVGSATPPPPPPPPSAPAVTASFDHGDVSGTGPLSVRFTDTSKGSPTSWAWDFGDGTTSTQQNPTHEYAAAGTYTVKLTASNADHTDTTVATDLVHVFSAGGPRVRMSEPTGWYTTSRTVPVAWALRNDTGGDTTYELSGMVAPVHRGFHRLRTVTTSLTSGVFTGLPGRTYCLQVHAVNALGVAGPESNTRCTSVPLDDRNLVRHGHWKTVTNHRSYLGTALRTRAHGASVFKKVRAKRIFLLVTTGRRMGEITIYNHGRKVTTASLHSVRKHHLARIPVAGGRRMKHAAIRVVVTSKGKPVVIDGLAISQK